MEKMEKKDITNFVKSIQLVEGISEKTGQPYSYFNIVFINDYDTAVFSRSRDAMYIVKNVIVKD